jgi:hypothetical protein
MTLVFADPAENTRNAIWEISHLIALGIQGTTTVIYKFMDWQRTVTTILEELDKIGEAQSCILVTAVLLDVLKAKGIKDAYPLTVKYKVLNPKAAERVKNEMLLPQTPEQVAQWNASGCAIVSITDEDTTTHWAGHLVVVIPKGLKGRDAICDLAITQASAPEWDIRLYPVLMGALDSFLNGTEKFSVPMNGCLIMYEALPDNQSFRQTTLWKHSLKRELTVKRILKRLKY